MDPDPVTSAFAMGGPGSSAIAAGSVATARAGAEALRAGGNAVDAVVGAALAAMVAEQVVTSLGGGGFLMVRTPQGQVHVRDFFVDTPGRGLPVQELDLHFLPLRVQFPGSVQTFHAGMGSVAVPGTLSGVLRAHQEFCRLPLRELAAPARRYAFEGVPMEPIQEVFAALSRDLLALSPGSRALFERDGRWLVAGDLITNPDLGVFLDRMADGEVTSVESTPFAAPLLDAMAAGGLVTAADLDAYRVIAREPATARRAGYEIFTNPPPSFGGSIIADTLTHAAATDLADPGSWVGLLRTLAAATTHRRMGLTTPLSVTGTTHCSAVDSQGMVAAMTTSNGISSGFVVPGTGIQLNNMLGEADLNPDGFHATPPGQRLGSMMSPSVLVAPDGGLVALGTGGSERIRSSLVEVMVRIIDGGQSLVAAISGARVHPDAQGIQVEPHLPQHVIQGLRAAGLAPVNVWREPSLFFGGVNAVQRTPDGRVLAVSDGRRGGGAIVLAR